MARPTHHRAASVAAAALTATTLLLAACGGDDTTDAGQILDDPPTDITGDAAEPGGSDGETGGASATRELQPLTFHLPADVGVPAGFQQVDARCQAEDELGAWYSFAVPDGWERTGYGGGGGGSPLGDSSELRFSTGAGEVSVAVEPDHRMPDGPPLDHDGQPFESFDYESSRGGDTVTIEFETVETVEVGSQDVEVVVADPDQAPDHLGQTTYKARLDAAALPNPAPGDEDGVFPHSMVLTVAHDPDDGEVPPSTVTAVVASFSLPECSRERIVAGEEVKLGEDLDGDGEVSTPQDLMTS